ncbi:uncharacterized protein BCR38DRAFT_413108 [Pseudomassariella vexata]|uniref:Uncharacterized protein n=1 Tax=Pseudomassariella vexata TaxID=1141098 RepID=A0A1Y2DHT6_9PEZI|nr:uncharacterized protein BCR38DRAFT_413108 [Pseudomassariella vexata]ORY58790.1 hypothetical protein BCR38DRAFT_413108 [Pseudomassariella vexata]
MHGVLKGVGVSGSNPDDSRSLGEVYHVLFLYLLRYPTRNASTSGIGIRIPAYRSIRCILSGTTDEYWDLSTQWCALILSQPPKADDPDTTQEIMDSLKESFKCLQYTRLPQPTRWQKTLFASNTDHIGSNPPMRHQEIGWRF